MQARRRLLSLGGGLPSAYRAIEYLENSGTQYIATSFEPDSSDLCIVWDYMQTKTISGDKMMFGVRNGNGGSVYAELYNNDRWYAHAQGAAYQNVSAPSGGNSGRVNNTQYHVVMSQASFVINGYSFSPTNSYTPNVTGPLHIFAWKNMINGQVQYISDGLRMYGLTLLYGTVPQANFLPCVRKSDNKPGMYDTVTKTFYTNAGTGEFIVPA